ncbi:acyl-CoA dehydrogenase [Salmonella enterica]|nr:acyl-CoA dehydrogenase [Salmonella enterica]
MDFSLTEEQELLLASIRELITSNFPEEYFRTCDQTGTYPREFMQALAENGISMLGVPEEFGGIPADYVTQMLALMEISKCGAPAFLITNGQCIHSMRRFGSAEQLRKTAESTLATGDPAYALALTEPGAGSDNNSATTTWTRKHGKVYLNGQKTFITGAKEYPYMLVLARDTEPKDPKKAFTLWWVDSNKPGIKINPLHKIGWHMLSTCEVYLDNVEIDESDRVGEEGMGFLNVMYNFEMERLINAARSTGFAECAFEDAARYANQRIAFGKPIGHNQMIQEKLALMAIKIENMRNMVLKVAWQADREESLRTSAALAKLYCARTAMEVIDDAIQIMGGLGYTDEARVSRFWRDVRCERIGGGTDEIMIYVAGRQILKDYQNK